MTAKEKTGLEIGERGTTLIVRINGGKRALLSPDLAAALGKLVDRADKDPNIHAVVFTGAHPDRFLSHADVTWLQEGRTGFPRMNTRVAGIVSRMARLINRLPIVRSLAGVTRLKTLLQLEALYATMLKMNASGAIFIAVSGRTSGVGNPQAIVNARANQHPERLAVFGPPVVDFWATGPQGYIAIRGREQQLIDANGGAQSEGGTSANIRRGVNKRVSPLFEAAATAMFGPPPPPLPRP